MKSSIKEFVAEAEELLEESQRLILEIQDMAPMTEDLHLPARPYRYALEVNQGFFSRNGVVPGDRVEIQLGGS